MITIHLWTINYALLKIYDQKNFHSKKFVVKIKILVKNKRSKTLCLRNFWRRCYSNAIIAAPWLSHLIYKDFVQHLLLANHKSEVEVIWVGIGNYCHLWFCFVYRDSWGTIPDDRHLLKMTIRFEAMFDPLVFSELSNRYQLIRWRQVEKSKHLSMIDSA